MVKNEATVFSSGLMGVCMHDRGRMRVEGGECAHGHVGQGEHIQQDIALVQVGIPGPGGAQGGGCWKYLKRGSLIGVSSL